MSDEQERMELALRRIIGIGHCESFTTGLGACFRAARKPNGYYGEETCCAPCIAHQALYPEADVYRSAGVR